MTRQTPEQAARAAVRSACSRARPALQLLAEVAEAVHAAVPYQAAGWLLVDPDRLLITGVHPENVTPALQRALVEHEAEHDDVNAFTALARRSHPAARLSAAADGDLTVSSRHRALYAPNGLGDEMRAVFRTGTTCWGEVCLTRPADGPAFTDRDVALLGELSAVVGHALRASLAVTAATTGAAPGVPGLVVLDDEDCLVSVNDVAQTWLDQVPSDGTELPAVVYAVARRARAQAEGDLGPPAAARVRTRTGGYLLVRGTCLVGPNGDAAQAAVVVEPARRSELASLVLALGDLTPREKQVTQLLLRGGATADIARQLWISPYTLREHVKAVFAKLGVHSRAELAALLHDQHLHGVGR